jgi:hypothetical protein
MKHNPVAPSTELKLGEHTYSLRWDFEAIARAEDLTDKPLLTGLRPKDVKTPTISLVRAMLFACISANHPDVTYEHVSALVTRKTFSDIWLAVLNAWAAGIGEADEADTDPKTAQA